MRATDHSASLLTNLTNSLPLNSVYVVVHSALRNGKRTQKRAIERFAKRIFPRAITPDNGRAWDNPCKYAKASNCKQSNLNVTLAAADVYISHCAASLRLLRVCAADKGDGVSPENVFRNDARRVSTYNSITRSSLAWRKRRRKKNYIYPCQSIFINHIRQLIM